MQVAASALAAVSAAVVSSTFGVAGTVIGAAIASVVASVGSTLYLASLHNTNERLRRMAVAARRTDWSGGVPTRLPRTARTGIPQPPPRVDEPELPFPTPFGQPAGQPAPSDVTDAETPAGWDRLRWSNLRSGVPTLRRRWVAVAGLALVVFAIAIGLLTALGASTQHSAFPLGGSGGSGKSPTAPASSPAATRSPTASPTVSTSPSASTTPTTTPTPTPTASASATPAPGASSPAPAASAGPPVGAPVSPTPATVP